MRSISFHLTIDLSETLIFYDAYLYHENLLGSVCTTAEGNLERKKCTYISIKFHSVLDFIQIGQEMITKKKSNE